MNDDRDDFWDLPEITPKKRTRPANAPYGHATDAAEVSFGSGNGSSKYLIPRQRNSLEREKHSEVLFEYSPENSLILHVKICRWPTDYSYYNRFLQDAHKYYHVKCESAEFVPFFSYLPQYNQMNIDQLRYYLYWRMQVSRGNYIKTDYSYIFLYAYELINLEDVSLPERRLSALCSLLSGYRHQFKSLDRYLGEWICDFCLIHRLPPPDELSDDTVSDLMTVVNLREFYVKDRNDIHDAALRDFIIRNNSYKYENSTAYGEKTRGVFEKHLINSVIYTLEKTENIKDGEPELSKTVVSRTAYNGALCVSETKCRIDAEYLSLNRSYRFRGMITSLVKCAENNIRAALDIKNRLSTSNLSAEATDAMKEYYSVNLPPFSKKPAARKSDDDDIKYALYEAESTGFDPSAAARLEEHSWELTRRLVDGAAMVDEVNRNGVAEEPAAKEPERAYADTQTAGDESKTPFETLCGSLPPHALEFLRITAEEGGGAALRFCRENGLMADAVISDINDLSYEITGDVIIENSAIAEDYKCDVFVALNAVK